MSVVFCLFRFLCMDDHPGDLHCLCLDCIYTRVLAPEEPRFQGSWEKRDDDDDLFFSSLPLGHIYTPACWTLFARGWVFSITRAFS